VGVKRRTASSPPTSGPRTGSSSTGAARSGQRRRQRAGPRLPGRAVRRHRRRGVPDPGDGPTIGVGRQNGSLSGTDPNTPSPQNIVANGIVVTRDGDLVVADTARGALWNVRLDSKGRVTSPTGCDETYTADTVCLDAVAVEHPTLEGAEGIALDAAGRIWVDANERNTVAVVDRRGGVTEFFRNPVDPATSRRNAGPLEFPTSPVFLGRQFCTTSSDGARRHNFPNTGGEVAGTGKISCLDQHVDAPGVPLPVR
jgi:hypothetical protein